MADMIPRWEHIERRLDDHIAHDNERYRDLNLEIREIKADVRTLLEARWKIVGAVGVAAFIGPLVVRFVF